jgi:hypothetical protein
VLDKKHIIKEKKIKYVNIEKDTSPGGARPRIRAGAIDALGPARAD